MPDPDRKLGRFGTDRVESVSLPTLVLAAHPDDETIGASAILGRSRDIWVAYLTDGAPRDPALRSGRTSREEYAKLRQSESQQALKIAGIDSRRILHLGGVDQDTVFMLEPLVHGFVQAASRIRPDRIVTHAYEGGHPDHDSAAFVAATALRLLQMRGDSNPLLLEMTSYHAENEQLSAGRFLPGQDQGWQITLSSAEMQRKQAMLASYISQEHVLRDFPLVPERLRLAPDYDFQHPPHVGKLWYECLGWPMTSTRWCALASQAMQRSAREAA